MKLTGDDVYAIEQALRHCNKQDAYIFTSTGEEKEETVDYYKLYKKFNGQQILENQEIAGKYDDLMKANSEIVQNNISHTQIFQENKQLKESNYNFTITNEKLRDELQVKVLEIEELERSDCVLAIKSERNIREMTEGKYKIVLEDYRNLKQKLSKIEELHKTEFNAARMWKKLQAIFEEKS